MNREGLYNNINVGDRRLVGQSQAREQIRRTLQSGRMGHAYLFTGPAGSGKTAFALAFAELLNGIDNLTDLKGAATTRKPNWFSHPDIHLFIPLPTAVTKSDTKKHQELRSRLELLRDDPYEIVDFRLRPALHEKSGSKNRQAFYPIDYYREDIRTKSYLKPNEGNYTVVILTDIELMRDEASNSFLKLLEEPPENVIFLMTTGNEDRLLPTILSRCQQIRLNPLAEKEIAAALEAHEGYSSEEARFMARIADGNYAITRFFDLEALRTTRDEILSFLRKAYVQDVAALLTMIQDWQSKLNTEGQIALCNSLELLLRDILVYRESGDEEMITNIDQKSVIAAFCDALPDARIMDMISHLGQLKPLLFQNVQFKFVFTVLAIRFGFLMRGRDPYIPEGEEWRHLPALTLNQ
ncbi:MAG: RuvB-like domain-containing protein [Balneolaceae bacterium]